MSCADDDIGRFVAPYCLARDESPLLSSLGVAGVGSLLSERSWKVVSTVISTLSLPE